MRLDSEELARFVRVEPPAELDAWVRAKLRAAITEHSPPEASPSLARLGLPNEPPRAASHLASKALRARRPAPVPLVERLALAVGAVACGAQASALVVRVVWAALSLGR